MLEIEQYECQKLPLKMVEVIKLELEFRLQCFLISCFHHHSLGPHVHQMAVKYSFYYALFHY